MTGFQARGVALCAALMLVAGCGGGDDKDGTAASTPAATATPEGEATADGTATPEGTAAPAEGASIAEGKGSANGHAFVFRITELKRSGPTVVLNATVELAPETEESASIQIAGTFGDGQFQTLEDSDADETGSNFDGVALIDPEGRKKYLVARESTGRCVCSTDLGAAFVGADSPISLEATLSAPPEDVAKVNVFVPNVKTFVDVPIS